MNEAYERAQAAYKAHRERKHCANELTMYSYCRECEPLIDDVVQAAGDMMEARRRKDWALV